ncbi:unannotated protein [freshwater metagenome]|uniref:Unannotated protein n=1 Tax=freshwater metagenome TaxID=449393 RepID=A0A6J7I487_9ZZZZ|nr:YggT family protein [Actinomycetota bacterium]
MTTVPLVLGDARGQVADYFGTLLNIYVVLIFVHILASLFFSFGGRVPYNRALNAVLEFLRHVCEPYLRVFRRFIPPLGPVDLSPLVAILALTIVGGLIVGLVRG